MQKLLFVLIIMLLGAFGTNSCSIYVNHSQPANTLSPQTVPTTSIQKIDSACTQVIVKFLQTDPCKNWDEFHHLFTPASRHFQSTPIPSNDPSCDLKTSNTILRIMPADEWWPLENPNQHLPESAKPTLPNEYVFFVEYEIQWRPGVVPASENPARMLMWMVFDNDNSTCLIREFGW
jgi:hypothetical protein